MAVLGRIPWAIQNSQGLYRNLGEDQPTSLKKDHLGNTLTIGFLGRLAKKYE